MFKAESAFNVTPSKVHLDACLEFDSSTGSCRVSNGTLKYNFTLRCLSRQFFPNGTVITESSVAKRLSVDRYVKTLSNDMEPKTDSLIKRSNVGATVITTIIVIIVIIAIALVCYAQKYKVSLFLFRGLFELNKNKYNKSGVY